MLTLINGASGSAISVSDRGFLYGDGAFETLAIRNSQFILLEPHLDRLQKASTLLRIPFDRSAVIADLETIAASVHNDGVCKIILTRGEGGRGYKAALNGSPTRIVQYFETPLKTENKRGIIAAISSYRLGQSTQLAGLKHLNRLDQVMASFDLTDEIFEVICLDQQGFVIEGSRSNLIAVLGGQIVSPNLDASGVRGIMLDALIAKFADVGKSVEFTKLSLDDIGRASELMFCNSVFGVWPVIQLLEDGRVREWSIGDVGRQAIAFQDELFGTSI